VPLPTFRRPTAVTVLTALVAGGLVGALPAAGPATAAPDPSPGTAVSGSLLRSGDGVELPRGTLRQGPRQRPAASPRSAAPSAPVPPASLTAAAVSTIGVTFVNTTGRDGRAWTEPAKAAVTAAVGLWQRTIESRVPIQITATARAVEPGALGSAAPTSFVYNDNDTAQRADDIYEPVALANARSGVDNAPGEADVDAFFDPTLDFLYLGLDGRPPADLYDFRSIALHEIGHGLGLVGTGDVVGGRAQVGFVEAGVRIPTRYDTFVYATTREQAGRGGTRVTAMADGSPELTRALTGDQLYWAGQQARAAAGDNVKLFSPSQCDALDVPRLCRTGESSFLTGSSYGHLNEASYPRGTLGSLMTPVLDPGEGLAGPDQLTLGLLSDLGYAVPAQRGSRFTALDPVRLLDTRRVTGPRVGAGGVVDVKVTQVAGVPRDATAVVLNVTGVLPSVATDLRVYPTPITPGPVPTVSNVNLTAGVTRANLVTVPIGADGRVRLRNSAGSVALLADLAGFYAPTAASTFTAVDPVRVLDTGEALGTATTTPVPAGGTVDLHVTGVRGVPAGATAVALTLTAVGASRETDVRAYPAGPAGQVPLVSNLNVPVGRALPNVVIVKVGAGGKVRLLNRFGDVRLLADLAGYYDGTAAGSLFRPVTPTRVLDTRTRLGTSATTARRIGPGGSLVLTVGGAGPVPRKATSAVLNVTGVEASEATDVRAYPTSAAVPRVSNLNLVTGQTNADLVIVKLADGRVTLRNAAGSIALVADAAGWFGPA